MRQKEVFISILMILRRVPVTTAFMSSDFLKYFLSSFLHLTLLKFSFRRLMKLISSVRPGLDCLCFA